MASSAKWDGNYYTLKIWREETMPAFVELKSLRQLRLGENLDNVSFLDSIIKEALEIEKERVLQSYTGFGGRTTAKLE